jgi:protoheme IX farnesyltransferase
VLAVISLFAIAAGAGASGAINQWYDRDMDALMTRTRNRPIPAGKVMPEEALAFGIVISVLSVMLLSLASNLLAGGLLAFTIFFYAVVYTVWLKRSTPQNIVIGGAAGALPPLVGWAAMTGTVTLEPIILFALIFIWTPPHFWALALVKNDDYRAANVPMLPVTAGADETRKQILIYSFVLMGVGILPFAIGMSGIAYGILSVIMGALFLAFALRLYFAKTDKAAWDLFKFSVLHLFALFAGLIADKAISFMLI